MAVIDDIISFEGLTTWLYLDTADPPVVTCGIGHALFSLADCLALPWDQPAAAIQWDFKAVQAAAPGRLASWYATLTKSRLEADFVRQLAQQDLDARVATLRKGFPQYDGLPAPAREALQDMVFNLGGSFLGKWPKLRTALLSGNWSAAAANCHRIGISDARNAATAALFTESGPPALA
jgi:GH24 family phage-related lysozyme (muramidase)